jgi:hypothetical protein
MFSVGVPTDYLHILLFLAINAKNQLHCLAWEIKGSIDSLLTFFLDLVFSLWFVPYNF